MIIALTRVLTPEFGCNPATMYNFLRDMVVYVLVFRYGCIWIQLWVFLLPEDHQENMVTRYNRLVIVAEDFFFQATVLRHIKRIGNG